MITHIILKKCSDGTSIIFAINLQVPAGPRHFSLIFYYKIEAAFLKVIWYESFGFFDISFYIGPYIQ
jgi:hypothetical protein